MTYLKSYFLAVFEVTKVFGIVYLCTSSLMGVPLAVFVDLLITVIALGGPLALLIEKKKC